MTFTFIMSDLANDFAHTLVWFYSFVYSIVVLLLSKFIEVFLHILKVV